MNSDYSFCGCSTINSDIIIDIKWIKKAIDELIKFNLSSIHIVGGDPFLSPNNLKEIITFAVKKGIKTVSILSNCSNLDAALGPFLQRHKINIMVPMYHHEPRFHDSITRVDGSLVSTLNNVSNLLKSGVKVILVYYQFPKYINESHETIRCLKKMQGVSIKKDFIYPMSRRVRQGNEYFSFR